MNPHISLRHYNRGEATEHWAVFVYGRGDVAVCPTSEGAVAAMRLFGGRSAVESYAAYLKDLGCRPGEHEALDALIVGLS